MKTLITVDLESKHPNMPELTRSVSANVGLLDGNNEKIDIIFSVNYFRDGVETPYKPTITEILDNNKMMLQRNFPDFTPKENPDFDEETMDESERYLTAPAFDYTRYLLFEIGVPVKNLLENHILEMEQDGRFDI